MGASFRFVITNLQDHKIVEAGSLLAQQSYLSLLPPYAHLGVGRSNNYIESFNGAMGVNGKAEQVSRTPIIPNSQLILVYEYDQSAENSNWELSLVISPDENMLIIMASCGVLLLVLGITIIALHFMERREDYEKRPPIPVF